ncbi:MAG: hypothetical protein A3J37_07170 [Alphaproteobacteria bacterium RIFCSPHIGHO2_12_FULL_45_9]|nr:MAG: hypothetical protein A3B66_04690 [Alphaproteobacteria bacterium RIFCSPHIGHO2_02_FULL_46_13]OFW95756.1 MAG: hypothetical protein A3J37_07170 [Alphaproteobacteria bacterium RIFCSPHIGHO2_12_FULL_45_9]
MNKEKKYGVWDDFFQSEFSPENYKIFSDAAISRAQIFMSSVQSGLVQIDDGLTTQSFNPELDQWVSENDDLLTELVRDIQSHIRSVVEFSLPAHDERQIMFKDAAEGLRFYQMEKPQGYKATFVIPMFAHDIGRLLEGRLYAPLNNPHDQWTPHSKFSFLMLQKILEQPQYQKIPKALKDHYLYAVLAHSGDNGVSYMSRAVQTCDRMQLIGAEGFYRALSYGTCLMDADIKYPEDPHYKYTLPNMFEHQSVLSILEYCSRNMRQNIGTVHASWQHRIAVENVVLLKAACEGNDELTNRLFAPECDIDCAFGPQKGRIDATVLHDADLLYACSKVPEVKWSPYEVASVAVRAIEMPMGAAKLSDSMKKSIHRAVGDMSDVERKSLFLMMSLADQFRAEQDEIDQGVSLLCEADQNGYVRTIAKAIRGYTNHAPVAVVCAAPFHLGSVSPSYEL